MERTPGFDLLRLRPLRALIRWWGFPYVFQGLMLLVFVGLAVFGWGCFAPEGVPDKLFAQTNLVTLLIWGLWWPLMVWAAVLFGRVWCMVCPLELVANGCERLGRGMGLRQRTLGRWLQSGALIVALFAALQMLVPGVHLHRVPAYTSVFLWSMLAAAVLVGFCYKDRAFCRGFCPVGLLLNAYSRGAMLAVRPASGETCRACPGKDCVQTCLRTRLDARSCPSLLNPARLQDNSDCLVCGQCVKVCAPGNMGLFLRRPFHPADAREPLASWPVALFLVVVSGFVISELCSEWGTAKEIYAAVPERVAAGLGLADYAGWIEGLWTIAVVPAVVWLILGLVAVLASAATGLADAFRRLALPLAVVIAAGHSCKGLAKLNSWVGFLPVSAENPSGVGAAFAINAKAMDTPARILPMGIVSVLAMALVLAAGWFAQREVRLARSEGSRSCQPSILLLSGFFVFLVFGWGFLG